MATATKYWSIDAIRDAMQADGSHWWNRDTMRFFGTEIASPVFNGLSGVFFVTQDDRFDRVKGFKVRQYRPDRNDLTSVGPDNARGAEPPINDPHTVAAFDDKAAAIAVARRWAGGDDVTEEASLFHEKTAAEDLARMLTQDGGCKCDAKQAGELIYLATCLQRVAEQLCNGPDGQKWTQGWQNVRTMARGRHTKKAEAIAKAIGAVGVVTGGDPRGGSLRIACPKRWTDERSGLLAVPTNDGEG